MASVNKVIRSGQQQSTGSSEARQSRGGAGGSGYGSRPATGGGSSSNGFEDTT